MSTSTDSSPLYQWRYENWEWGRAPWRTPPNQSNTACEVVAISNCRRGKWAVLYCGVVYASVCVCVCVLDLACMHSCGQRFSMVLTHCTLVQHVAVVLLHLHCAGIRVVIPPEGSCRGVHVCTSVCVCERVCVRRRHLRAKATSPPSAHAMKRLLRTLHHPDNYL